MRSSVDELLEQRCRVYGDFGLGTGTEALILQSLCNMHEATNKKTMSPQHQVWLAKIVMKLVRLGATPTHIDSWLDISGYATLVKTELENDNAKS